MSSWLETSQAGGRGFGDHLAKHFTPRFGKCWRLRPNPARGFGAQPCGFTANSKPEVVDTSRCRGEAQSCPLAATQPTQRAFQSTRFTDEGASKRRSQCCDLICRCDPPLRGRRRSASAGGWNLKAERSGPRSACASTGSPWSDGAACPLLQCTITHVFFAPQ